MRLFRESDMSDEHRKWEWEREGKPRDIFGIPDDGSRRTDLVAITIVSIMIGTVAFLTFYGLHSLLRDAYM